ncbi:MAG: BACON domain-containing protein [Prevotella sp.]|nr:BACON domain-containing protein [Prevotella sp.]
MKKLLSIMILLAGVISFTSCSNDDPTYTAPAQLSLKSADAFFEAAGGTGSIVVNSSEAITATSNVDWLTVAVSGNTVTLTVAANDRLEGRSTNVLLKSATATKEVNITQRGIIYGLVEGNVYQMADTDNAKISIPVAQTTNVTVASLTDWLTASFNSATSNIEIVAASNDTETERIGFVAIQTGVVKDTLVITQNAILFNLEKTAIEVPNTGGVQPIAIEHSRPVSVEAGADWMACEFNATADTLFVSVAENTGEAREGTITVKTLDITKTITVTQKGAEATDPQDPQEEENPLLGTFTFYWSGQNTYDLGNFTIEEYKGEDAEEGDVILKDFYVPGNTIYGFYTADKLYIYAYQKLGILVDPDYGDYGNLLMSVSDQDVIAFDITPDGIVSTDLCIMATDPDYTQGWWWEIPEGGTTLFVKATTAAARRAAAKGGIKSKSRENLPTNFKLFHK